MLVAMLVTSMISLKLLDLLVLQVMLKTFRTLWLLAASESKHGIDSVATSNRAAGPTHTMMPIRLAVICTALCSPALAA